ncbi:MAG: hypothetical protein H6822_14335 [Planctomycetaceae bacterium]|nr:hypothetical protein [Planctomycetales bacterium]MCB9923357.1 hypothetical protein [Planctomycetaceae bacterium]
MSIKSQVHTELNRLASLATVGKCSLQLDVGDGKLDATLTQIDQLGCAFEHFSYKVDKLANASIEQLKDVANDLSKRLCYLLESISPIEIDNEACIVQMRSNPPQKDDDGTKYYELVVARGELTLCRFSLASGQQRRIVAANVTREVFERLAEDFVAIVS